jgi:hypothetical protein
MNSENELLSWYRLREYLVPFFVLEMEKLKPNEVPDLP